MVLLLDGLECFKGGIFVSYVIVFCGHSQGKIRLSNGL